jgi:undecaprenyl-diphosphatase
MRHSFLSLAPAPTVGSGVARQHPFWAALVVTVIGYVIVAAVIVGLGLLLTHPLNGSVGGWDWRVSEFFARHRTGTLNAVTKRATSGVGSLLRVRHASLPALIVAAIVTTILVWRGRWREAVFLALAFALEVTTYRSVLHFVSRQRPHVFDLSREPSNTSFPSGHTAAATVLFVGITLIVIWTTRSTVLRIVTAGIAIAGISMVAFARVYRAQHSLLDVLAGVLLGLGCLVVALVAVRAASRRATARAGPLRPSEPCPSG